MYKLRMRKTITSERYRKFLKLLKNMRIERSITQNDMAKALDMTQSSYSKLETGDLRIDILQLESICGVIGVKLSDFIKEFEKLK